MGKSDKVIAELRPDAWERFERAIDVVAKSPPQHRAAKGKSNAKSRKSPAKRGASTKR